MEYPEMNDEFAQSLGEYETMEELRNAIRENLETSKQEEYDQGYVSQIIDQIAEGSTIKFAQITLDEEMENVVQSVKQDLGNQNLDLETYLKIRNTDQKTFLEEEIKPVAEQRLRRSLILDETARKEGIEISEDELQAGVTDMMTQLFNMPGFEKPRSDQDLRKLTNAVSFDTASRILNEKVLDRLKAIAKGEGDLEVEAEEESSEPEVLDESPEDESIQVDENVEEEVSEETVTAEAEASGEEDETKSNSDEEETESSEEQEDE
jgi:trigger factor